MMNTSAFNQDKRPWASKYRYRLSLPVIIGGLLMVGISAVWADEKANNIPGYPDVCWTVKDSNGTQTSYHSCSNSNEPCSSQCLHRSQLHNNDAACSILPSQKSSELPTWINAYLNTPQPSADPSKQPVTTEPASTQMHSDASEQCTNPSVITDAFLSLLPHTLYQEILHPYGVVCQNNQPSSTKRMLEILENANNTESIEKAREAFKKDSDTLSFVHYLDAVLKSDNVLAFSALRLPKSTTIADIKMNAQYTQEEIHINVLKEKDSAQLPTFVYTATGRFKYVQAYNSSDNTQNKWIVTFLSHPHTPYIPSSSKLAYITSSVLCSAGLTVGLTGMINNIPALVMAGISATPVGGATLLIPALTSCSSSNDDRYTKHFDDVLKSLSQKS